MKRTVEMDYNELAACFWALDFYLAAAAGLESRNELIAGAERAQAIVRDGLASIAADRDAA